MQLRPYQQEAYDNTLEVFKRVKSAIIVMATGLGKTVCFGHIVERFMPKGRVLVLAHREELILQAKDKIKQITGVEADVEMGQDWATGGWLRSDVVVSSIQTQCAGREGGRMTRFDPKEFSLVVVDECFPAGTLIDGVPIEKRRIGDRIGSFNHDCNTFRANTITHVFKRQTDSITEVTLSNGKKIVCTPNHPIFSLRGYVEAGRLMADDMVLSIMQKEREDYGIQDHLQNMPQELFVQDQKKNMLKGMPGQVKIPDSLKNKQEVCVSENEEKESHVQSRDKSKGFDQVAGDGMEADCEGWQWSGAYTSPRIAGVRIGLAYGVSNSNKGKARQWLSNLLQSGYRKLGLKIGRRSGRKQSQSIVPPSPRCKEGALFEYVGVESVAIYERGSSDRFEQLCPEGIVYNLEVENDNNFYVNGVLVHNCHHAPANTYKRVIEYYQQNPDLKVLGVTATPDRTDEKAMGQIFDEVAYAYDIRDGIDDGWLVPIEQQSVFVSGLDYSDVKTTAGELNGKDLARVLEFEENIHSIASPAIELTGDKKTLIFAASVAQAERLTEIINRHKPGQAQFVYGKTPKEIRRQMFADFAVKKFQYLVNVGVATEGFDDPGIEYVVLARPTKSRSLFVQMVGRGTRPLPGIVDAHDDPVLRRDAIFKSGKPTVTVLDFVGNAGKHKLVTTADILGGKYDDDVVELANKNAAKESAATGKPADVATELEKAEREIKKRMADKEEAAYRDKIVARAHFSTAKVNPFNVLDIDPVRELPWHKGKPPTQKQIEYLRHKGVDTDGMSFTHAKQTIETLYKRQQHGKATYKQTKLLQRNGINTQDVTFKQAGEMITELANNKWKTPNRWRTLPCWVGKGA